MFSASLTLVVGYSHSTKKFFFKDFFSKCDQIRRKLRIWSHLLKKSLMETFIFLCSVHVHTAKFTFLVLKVNESRYQQCGVTPYLSPGKIY